MHSVSNKDAIRLWHIVVVSWADFSNQTTMIAITKNEGSFVRPAMLMLSYQQMASTEKVRQESNDRLISVHISGEIGDVQ